MLYSPFLPVRLLFSRRGDDPTPTHIDRSEGNAITVAVGSGDPLGVVTIPLRSAERSTNVITTPEASESRSSTALSTMSTPPYDAPRSTQARGAATRST